MGSALADLREFPERARSEAGHQISRVQLGWDPNDWKPMSSIGSGVCEIRIKDEAGAFRVVYVTKHRDAIFVLHCFQKKTQKTSAADIALARRRYSEILG